MTWKLGRAKPLFWRRRLGRGEGRLERERIPKMTIMRHSGIVAVRKAFIFRVACVVLFCFLVIYAIHLYRKSYNISSRRPYLIGSGEYYRSEMMAGSVEPLFSQLAGSGNGGQLDSSDDKQGSPIFYIGNKLVHFDLKGMPPTVEAFKTIFPFLKNIGTTGVLMEYEDMFPFEGSLQAAGNGAAYNSSEIRTILGLAKANDLQVIPLVQTFGHLEFLLKLEDFASLREVPRYPQVICPTNNRSIGIITEMIDQVMALHPDIEYFHIGSDEVYYLGMCPLCQKRMSDSKNDPTDLFLHHVQYIANYVRTKHKVQPLMWDDEFRKLEEDQILRYGIGQLVEVVVWNYHPDVLSQLRPHIWQKYANIFKSVWIGSAFKGANKPNSMITNESYYLQNHYSWMDIISEYHTKINFKGIFLTGWQRYDHFSVLCEIFPVAIPSLVSCMLYLSSTGQPRMEKIFATTSSYLDCGPDRLFCQFPGSQIYNEVLGLSTMQSTWKRIKEQHVFLGWTQNVNIQLQFSSPSHVDSILQEVVRFRVELRHLQESLATALSSMFPDWSVQEWMLTNFNPLATEVVTLEEGLSKLAEKTTFPARPLVQTMSQNH